MPEIDVTFTLTEAELDAVSGGQASASLDFGGGFFALGPNTATVAATGVGVQALSQGGLAPIQSALITGTFTASAA
jgi:hypothetical protein